jgi:hypothetical protein
MLTFKQLEDLWRAQEDRKNWVLPSLDVPRSHYRMNYKRVQKVFPGEGKGELTLKELHVAVVD